MSNVTPLKCAATCYWCQILCHRWRKIKFFCLFFFQHFSPLIFTVAGREMLSKRGSGHVCFCFLHCILSEDSRLVAVAECKIDTGLLSGWSQHKEKCKGYVRKGIRHRNLCRGAIWRGQAEWTCGVFYWSLRSDSTFHINLITWNKTKRKTVLLFPSHSWLLPVCSAFRSPSVLLLVYLPNVTKMTWAPSRSFFWHFLGVEDSNCCQISNTAI